MAIDSAPKRKSVAGLPFHIFGPGVTPDSTPGQEWRQQVGWGYSGILADETQIPAVIYDGAQGYMLHTGGPTGAADGAALSFAWAGTLSSDGSAMTLLDIPGTVPAKLTRNADNTISFLGGSAGAVFENVTAAVAASLGFCVVFASCRGTHSSLVVMHAAGTITGVNTPGSATNLDLTTDWFLGADGGAAEFLHADTALWWAHNIYIDASDAEWREQFYDTVNDLLRDPGSTGANALGGVTQPLLCHKGHAASHPVNAGSGGDADTTGTFTDGASPGSYSAALVNAFDLLLTAAAWWSADHSANSVVSAAFDSFVDRTANGNNAVAGGSTNRPARVDASGVISADFNGAANKLAVSSPTASLANNFSTGGTSLEVTAPDSDGGSNFGRVWRKGTGLDLVHWAFEASGPVPAGNLLYAWTLDHVTADHGGTVDNATRYVPVGQRHITGLRYSKAVATFNDMFVQIDGLTLNGTTAGNLDNILAAPSGAATDLSAQPFVIGGDSSDDANGLDGDVYEMALWNTELTDAQVDRLDTHMGRKYSVTLS